jgi:tetratricopeptide (TPR) repeat protein
MGYDSFKIGLSCKHQGHHQEALRWLEEARRHLAGEEGITAWLGNTLLMTGECHFALGSPDQAIDCFEQAANLAVSAGHVQGVVNTYNGLAGLYRQLGDEQNAERWLASLRQVLASLGIDPSAPAKP